MTKLPAKSVTECLKRQPTLSSLLARCRLHARLLRHIRRHLPEDLAAHCLACVLDSRGRLTIYVPSPAWASRLRYCQRWLLAATAERFPVRSCRIRVWLEPGAGRSAPDPKTPSAPVLRQLARSLEGVDDASLQRSLRRLVETLRRRADGSA